MADDSLTLTFHGAAETVTGSCMELAVGKRRILVDCGLFQMRRELQRRQPRLTVCLPRIGETYSLTAAKPARRLTTGRPEAQRAVGRDWQNAYADLVSGLKGDLGKIPEERRQEAIQRLREVLRSYNAFRDSHRERAKG